MCTPLSLVTFAASRSARFEKSAISFASDAATKSVCVLFHDLEVTTTSLVASTAFFHIIQDSDRLGSLLANGIIRSFVDQCATFSAAVPFLLTLLPCLFICRTVAFFLFYMLNTSITNYSDTARSLSREAPLSRLWILPASTPGCLRASGSLTPRNTNPFACHF
jgi:hypothetical protein